MNAEASLKPTDLRGILKYVPQFRGHVFVIALDGSIIDHENFANVVTDIAVLKSLNIKLVLIHGIGCQLRDIAEESNKVISNEYGDGPTDDTTMKMAISASAKARQKLIEALSAAGLKCASTNAIRGAERGIVKGKSWGLTGQPTNIDTDFINNLINSDVIPVVGPIILDRDGRSLRGNSDEISAEVAIKLKASKLIYLTPFSGLETGRNTPRNIPVGRLKKQLSKLKSKMDTRLFSKASCCISALDEGVPRAHVLDGRIFGGLLTEIFDKVGLGTMIHANDYQSIRRARKKDLQSIYNITRSAMKGESLKQRSRLSIEKDIQHYYVYEIDDSVIACAALYPLKRSTAMEIGSIYVQPYYENRGIGQQLVDFTCAKAKAKGAKKVIALSTQAYTFFTQVCKFTEGDLKDLPAARRKEYEKNKRNSKILIKKI